LSCKWEVEIPFTALPAILSSLHLSSPLYSTPLLSELALTGQKEVMPTDLWRRYLDEVLPLRALRSIQHRWFIAHSVKEDESEE
jgi:hypothetical protein